MSTASATKPMTADELLARSCELGRCELIRGELIKMSPPGGEHGSVCADLTFHISRFVRDQSLGKVYAAETGFVLERNPDTVRGPDVAFIRSDRVSEARTPKHIPIPPDLAVEVNSPNDVIGEVVAKVQWWLEHGVRGVWVVDPRSKTVTTYHPDGSARVVQHGESLEGTRMGPPLTDAGVHWKRPALRRYLANPDSARRADPRLRALDEHYRRFTMPSYEFEDDAFEALATYLLQPR